MKHILLTGLLFIHSIATSQDSWDSLYANLEVQYNQGKYQDVLNKIPDLIYKAKNQFGDTSIAVANTSLLKANCINELGKPKSAIPFLETSISIYKAIEWSSFNYAYAKHILGQTHLHLKNYEDAEQELLQAGEVYEKRVGSTSEFYFYLLKDLLQLYKQTENTEGVYTVLQIYAPLEEELYDYQDSDIGGTYLLLAKLEFEHNQLFVCEKHALKSLHIFEKYHPEEKERIAEVVYLLLKFYFLSEDYHLVGPLIEELGKNIALSANNLSIKKSELQFLEGVAAYHLKNFNRAIKLLTECSNNLTPDKNIKANRFLGLSYSAIGRKDEALMAFTRAIQIEKSNDVSKWQYTQLLNDKATVLIDLAEYDEATDIFEKALNYSDKTDKNLYLNILSNLANLYGQMGQYSDAEKLYLTLIESLESNPVKQTLYLAALNNLGMTYLDWGEYSKCELLLNECIKIAYNKFGQNSKVTANAQNNLGAFYFELGNYSRAVDLLTAALSSYKEIDGVKSTTYSSVLNNIGMLFMEVEEYEDAALFLDSVKVIEEEIIGLEHPDYATTLNNLAQINLKLGNFNNAISQTKEAMRIIEKNFSNQHPEFALYEMNLGNIYKEIRQFDKALSRLQSAYDSYRNNYGENHVNSAIAAIQLAKIHAEKGRYLQSKPLFNQAIDNLQNHLINYLPFLSEKEKNAFYRRYDQHFYDYFQFVNEAKENYPELQGSAFTLSLALKGMLLRSSRAMRNIVLNSGNNQLIELYDQWLNIKKRIAELTVLPVKQRGYDINELKNKANAYEKQLFQLSDELGSQSFVTPSWQNIQSKLLKRETVIEFVSYFDRSKKTTVYAALILKQEDELPKMIELFDEDQLIDIIDFYGANNYEYISSIYHNSTAKKNTLYDLIWRPMETALGASKRIYVSSTGLLHKVSLYAIATEKDKYLIDAYELISLNSLGDILHMKTKNSSQINEVTLVGGVDYSSDYTDKKVWSYLPGTKDEVEAINLLLEQKQRRVNYRTAKEGTETYFKSVAEKSDIIHVATHGFFFPDPVKIRSLIANKDTNETSNEILEFRGNNQVVGVSSFTQNKDPLMRSGLVFAGVHDLWSKERIIKEDDGILTAIEVSQMNLNKTELAVLSACETGLGEIEGNEGVYGLKRTFKIAGVNHLIISLWQVPDKETKEFMMLFYEKLFSEENTTITVAFEHAQRIMRQKYSPYFWAAFILIR